MLFDFGFLFLLTAGQALAFSKTDYDFSKTVAPTLKIHWKKVSDDYAYVALETTQTKGWTAFGVADPASGSMPGSDIVVASLGDSISLRDTYAMGKTTPIDDTCNDWVLVASETRGDKTYVEMKRKLVTNDPQDRPFNVDPDDPNSNMAVVFAWGSGTFGYHSGNRIATRINFKQPTRPDPFAAFDADSNIRSFEVRSAWQVKDQDTDYFDLYSGSTGTLTGICPEGSELVPGFSYTVAETGQKVRCNDAAIYCLNPDNREACTRGGSWENLIQFFASVGCCKAGTGPKRDPKKVCSGGSARECEEVRANGMTFQCSKVGTKSADSIDVLLLHGFPEYNKYWDPLLAHWESDKSSKIHAVACNLRGYSPGASPSTAGAYDFDTGIEKDAWAIADAVNFTSFHIVSHDFGAALSWRMASRKEHKGRILSHAPMAVYHPDALNKAIVEDEAQMVASNYFNQFSTIDSSKTLTRVLGSIPQTQLWWYHGAMGKIFTRPKVPSSEVFAKYPKLALVQGARAVLPIDPRPAVPATSPTGEIYAPTFMVCGSKDEYLLCDSAAGKGSKTYMATGVEYKHGSFACKHNLFKECTSADEGKKVMTEVTAWIQKNHKKSDRRRLAATTATTAVTSTTTSKKPAGFSCDTLKPDAAKVCAAAQAQGVATIPLADGVTNLDRNLAVEISSPAALPVDASAFCSPTDCNAYTLPAVTSFKFGTSATDIDTAQTRGGAKTVVKFDCDAAGDMYTLLFWDTLGFLGGPGSRTSKGFLHGAWVNIKCSSESKATFDTANTLQPYSPPANPSAIFANNYGFFLFKQKSKVPLTDGKLAGFNPSTFSAKGATIAEGKGLDIKDDVLAVLRPFLQDGGPKARAWANVKGSPFSAYALERVAPKNGFGQCGSKGGLGGPVEKVKAAWAKYKTADKACAAKPTEKPSAKPTGCRVFDQWLASKGGDYAKAIKELAPDEKYVLCEAFYTDDVCQAVIKAGGLTATWDGMCKASKGTSAAEILIDLEANPKKVFHMVGFKHIVKPGLEKHIHHMTVEGRRKGKVAYKQFMWVWALGMEGFMFPKECGVKLGGDGIVSIKINLHYDNPAPRTNVGKLDTSGIKVYYTDKLRDNECGTIAFGDPGITLAGKSLPKGHSSSVFTCPGECTKKFFPGGATIFASFLHQHEHGKRIWTQQYRAGSVIRTVRNDFWDHNFQLTQPVKGKVNPGDKFVTTCINYAPDDSLKWGLASKEEMCIDFVYYWPKVYDKNYCGYNDCGSMDDVKAVTDDKPVSFGLATCKKAPEAPAVSVGVTLTGSAFAFALGFVIATMMI